MEELLDEMEDKLHSELVDVFALFKAKLDYIPKENIEPTILYLSQGIANVKETLLRFNSPTRAKVIKMYKKVEHNSQM